MVNENLAQGADLQDEPQDLGRDWGVFACCALHAAVFGVAAWVLPVRWGWGVLCLVLLALAHGGVAMLAMRPGHPWFLRGFGLLGRLSLLCFFVLVAFSVHSASYVAELYGGLGRGIAGLIAAMLCVVALWTVPVGLWGLARGPKGIWGSKVPKVGIAGVLLASLFGMSQGATSPMPVKLQAPSAEELQLHLAPYLSEFKPASGKPGYRDPGPWTCERLDEPKGAVLAAFGYVAGKKRAVCVQVDSLDSLGDALRETKLEGLYRVDWITHRDPWRVDQKPWLTPVSLRPGIDGVCMEGRCMSAWQLVAQDAYLSLTPVSSIPDLRFGVDPKAVERWLLAKPGAAATRISTKSYIVDSQGKVTTLARQRKTGPEPSIEDLELARQKAQRYILSAQRPNGRFEYLRHVFLDQPMPDQLNLPRQAGTLASLCEWGERGAEVDAAVNRSLDSLTAFEVRVKDGSVLWPKAWGPNADLGATALPLIALLKCRGVSQGRQDVLIGRMLRALMRFQREDGGFVPALSLASGDPLPGQGRAQRLYSAGQAVLALLSALREQQGEAIEAWPDSAEIREAASEAMRYYGREYWSHMLGDFFFIEENWHCLAAKEALGIIDDEAYGDFCLDYLKFKSRFTLNAKSEVDPAFLGGYGFGNLIVPQATPSAGQAEALAGGIAVLRARGEDASALEAELRAILGFLWRQQLDEVNCRGCVLPHVVQGGFTESMISPTIRIDYVQHVHSALGAGVELLESTEGRL